MKSKFLLLVPCLLIAWIAMASAVNAQETPTLGFNPEHVTVPEEDIGKTFTIDLTITGVAEPGLWSWMVRITWNSSVISVTGATEGTFLSSVGATLFTPPRIVEGKIEEMASVLMVAKGATGSGTLATITFEVVGTGETDITIYESHLLEPGEGHPEITHEVVDAHFTTYAPPPPPEVEGRAIDLYTQREPYDGKGPNQASDAFEPGEEVFLHARVTYNADPVKGALVSFDVQGPINRVQNISFYRTNETEADGVATVSFRIPLSEEVGFGFWNVIATTKVVDVRVEDTLSFQVGWVVEVLDVETVDYENVTKASFAKGERMYFRVTVKNIAMTDKVATLVVNTFDNSNAPLGQVILEDKRVPANVTSYFVEDLLIPSHAFVGTAVAYVNAYTALPSLGGRLWCPEVSTTFEITAKPVPTVLRDVAIVNVTASPEKVHQGDVVHVTVVVKNNGDYTESFNVTVFYDSSSVGTLSVENLAPGMNRTLTFDWDTSSVVPGNYTIRAEASPVPGEENLADNTFVDGIVEVLPPPPTAELFWLLIFLVGIVLASLFGFVIFRKLRKRKKVPKNTLTARARNLCVVVGFRQMGQA